MERNNKSVCWPEKLAIHDAMADTFQTISKNVINNRANCFPKCLLSKDNWL